MAAAVCNLQGALGVLLPFDLAEVLAIFAAV
jgi:hypothetical protein